MRYKLSLSVLIANLVTFLVLPISSFANSKDISTTSKCQTIPQFLNSQRTEIVDFYSLPNETYVAKDFHLYIVDENNDLYITESFKQAAKNKTLQFKTQCGGLPKNAKFNILTPTLLDFSTNSQKTGNSMWQFSLKGLTQEIKFNAVKVQYYSNIQDPVLFLKEIPGETRLYLNQKGEVEFYNTRIIGNTRIITSQTFETK